MNKKQFLPDDIIRLRPDLNVQMIPTESGAAIVLQCPHGLTSQPLVLPATLSTLLNSLLAGISFKQLQQSSTLNQEDCETLLDILHRENLLFDNRFLQALENIKNDFLTLEERPLAFSGKVYDSNSERLSTKLHSGLKESQRSEPTLKLVEPDADIALLIAPHIDYQRGFDVYCKAFQAVRSFSPDRILLIGTSHQGGQHLFQFLQKNLIHPFGVHPLDRDGLSAFLSSYDEQLAFADQLLHRTEHSLELQLPFTGLLFPKTPVLPILVSSFDSFLSNEQSLLMSNAEYSLFIAGFQKYLSNKKLKTLIVAGVDMAHLGPAFGDRNAIAPEKCSEIAIQDNEYLRLFCMGDLRGFWTHVQQDQNARRLCGFSTLMTLLEVFNLTGLSLLKSEKFSYKQAVSESRDSLVSFSALTFSGAFKEQ